MANFRFRKSVKIAPGVRLNVGKRGVGLSGGVKGARVSTNTRTGNRVSAGIPGTGLGVEHRLTKKRRAKVVRERKPRSFRWLWITLAIIFVIYLLSR